MNKPKISKRSRDGIYFLDFKLDGKRIRKSLKTTDYNKAVNYCAKKYGEIFIPNENAQPIENVQEKSLEKSEEFKYKDAVDRFIFTYWGVKNAWKKGYPVSKLKDEGAHMLSVLKRFHRFSKIKYVTEIKYSNMQDFINSQNQYTNNTLNKYRYRFRRFLHFCFKNDWVIANEADKIDLLKKNKSVRYHFSDEEVKTVLESEHSVKYKSFFEFMLETGLRAMDTWELTQDNFTIKNGTMYMNVWMRKVSNPLDVPISKRARQIVESSGHLLFPWAKSIIERKKPILAIKRAFGGQDKGGVGFKFVKKNKITLHVFRHTLANRLREKNVPKDVIQQFLGHTSVTTTEIYANMQDSSGLTSFI